MKYLYLENTTDHCKHLFKTDSIYN